MLEPGAISALFVGGLGWTVANVGGPVVSGIAGNMSDRAFLRILRALADRSASARGTAADHTIAKAVRVAQVQALEQTIRTYKAVGKSGWNDPHDAHETDFIRSGLEFCRQSLGRCLDPKVKLNFAVTEPLEGNLAELLASPESDARGRDRRERARLIAETAVLDELREEIRQSQVPPGFEAHFRYGSGSHPPFVHLFASAMSRQLVNGRVRDIFLAGQVLSLTALTEDAITIIERIENRFGSSLERVEATIERQEARLAQMDRRNEAVLAGQHEILRLLAEEKGIPAAAIAAVLEKLGSHSISPDSVISRLEAAVDELVRLRAQLASSAPGISTDQTRAAALKRVDAGDFPGARELLLARRTELQRTRMLSTSEEARLVFSLAQLDLVQLEYEEAAKRFSEAASMVADTDADVAFGLRWIAAHSMLALGDDRADPTAFAAARDLAHGLAVEWPPERSTRNWALANYLEAQAMLAAAELDARWRGRPLTPDATVLRQAIAMVSASLRVLDPETDQSALADVTTTLGRFLVLLGRMESHDVLDEAEATLRRAIAIGSTVPNSDLGEARVSLAHLLSLSDSEEARRESVTLYAEVADRTRSQFAPRHRGYALHGLAWDLFRLAQKNKEDAAVRQALGVMRNAAAMVDRAKEPRVWAQRQFSIAFGLMQIFAHEPTAETLDEVVAICRSGVLDLIARFEGPTAALAARFVFGMALLWRSGFGERTVRLAESLSEFEAALSEATDQVQPTVVAMVNAAIAVVLTEQARANDRADDLRRATVVLADAKAAALAGQSTELVSVIDGILREVNTLLNSPG
jgi:hypothetical protein